MILALATWLKCFALHMAVVTNKELDRISNLLAYLEITTKASVASIAGHRGSCMIKISGDNGLKHWAKVDPSTYTQCFTNAAVSDEKWCK